MSEAPAQDSAIFAFRLLDHDPLDNVVEFEVLNLVEVRVLHILATLREEPGNEIVLELLRAWYRSRLNRVGTTPGGKGFSRCVRL